MEPVPAIRVHPCGAGHSQHIHVPSFTLQSAWRRTVDAIQPVGVGVKSDHSKIRQLENQTTQQSDDSRENIHMNVTKVLGLAAVGALLVLAAPTERAQAVSLASPGAAAAVQDSSKQTTTEVRWHHHHWHHHWHHHHWHHW
jgi:hypothetical protein